MPLWGTILTVIFSGTIAFVSLITFIRGIPTRDDIESMKSDIQLLINRLDGLTERMDKLTERFERHLEFHAYKRESE